MDVYIYILVLELCCLFDSPYTGESLQVPPQSNEYT